MTVTKRVLSNYNNILQAKVYFFLKKSMWMYLAAMLLLGYAVPLTSFGTILSALFYFFIFILVILVPLYHFSSKALAAKNLFDADIEFGEQQIIIRHRNKDLTETKDWSWVRQMDINRNAVLLVVNISYRFLIQLNKDRLTESEWQFFQGIKSKKFR
ncbi:hypothetical protein [Chitinophaga sp. 212800010-3]|uniref:hypothetical protein n=1 Tax=unclassified Chitinophaga TaxID=2619133 RepID=UPI002DE415AF|nr:YcxB domain-containing protein [Chitinophaga sp. 212800010-3]